MRLTQNTCTRTRARTSLLEPHPSDLRGVSDRLTSCALAFEMAYNADDYRCELYSIVRGHVYKSV